MKKPDLKGLVDMARKSPVALDIAALGLTFEFSDREQMDAPPLRQGQTKQPDLKGATIDLVCIAADNEWGISLSLRTLLERARGTRPSKDKRGRPPKEEERGFAILGEAYMRACVGRKLSDYQFAAVVGVSRPTLSSWRKNAGFQRDVKQAAAEFDDLFAAVIESTRRREL